MFGTAGKGCFGLLGLSARASWRQSSKIFSEKRL